jgi:hypothetical protein
MGWKAWPGRLCRLRCSLDFARNDRLALLAARFIVSASESLRD